MKVKCLALRPFLFQMTVLAIGELFSTTKGHATDLVADGLAEYATDTEGSDESAQDQPADKGQDSSDSGVAANEKNETQEKELTDDSDNAGSSEAPAAPVRKRGRSAPKSAD